MAKWLNAKKKHTKDMSLLMLQMRAFEMNLCALQRNS